jgi:hypothetical protein
MSGPFLSFPFLSLRRKNKKSHWKSLVGKVQHELKRDSWEEFIPRGNGEGTKKKKKRLV